MIKQILTLSLFGMLFFSACSELKQGELGTSYLVMLQHEKTKDLSQGKADLSKIPDAVLDDKVAISHEGELFYAPALRYDKELGVIDAATREEADDPESYFDTLVNLKKAEPGVYAQLVYTYPASKNKTADVKFWPDILKKRVIDLKALAYDESKKQIRLAQLKDYEQKDMHPWVGNWLGADEFDGVNDYITQTQTGKVKWFCPGKGYGFIAPEDGSADVFVHKTGLFPPLKILQAGDRVTFDVQEHGNKQKPGEPMAGYPAMKVVKKIL